MRHPPQHLFHSSTFYSQYCGAGVDGELWLATARHLAGSRDGALAGAREALRAGDGTALVALVADADAAPHLAEHRRLMGDA